MRPPRVLLLAVLPLAGTAFAACREPTQITVDITAAASCPGGTGTTLDGVAIHVGTSNTETSQCSMKDATAQVGSLAIIPGDQGTDGIVRIEVTALVRLS